MSTLASDDFERANNADLGANWTVVTSHSAFAIVGNAAAPSGYTSDCAERYSGIAWPDNQWAEIVVGAATATGATDVGCGVCLRAASGAKTEYRIVCNADATTNTDLGKHVAGTFTPIWNRDAGAGWTTGDVLRAEVEGDTIRVYKNGVQVGADTTDTSIASGDAGVYYSSNAVTGTIASWQAGDFDDLVKAGSGIVGP